MNKSQRHEHEHQLRQVCVPVCVAKGIIMLMMLNGIIMWWCQKVLQCVMQCVADDVKRHYHPAKGTIIMIMPFAGIYNASRRYMPHAHTQVQDASMHNCLSSRSLSFPLWRSTSSDNDDDAFITTNSGSVPFIEGLCDQILHFRYEIISGLRSHLLLFFFGRKNILKKKADSPRSHPASVLCTHIRIAVCVCVCVYTHTPTYTPTRVKIESIFTDNTPIFPSVKNNPPRQSTSAFIDYLNPLILVPPTLNDQTADTWAHMHIL